MLEVENLVPPTPGCRGCLDRDREIARLRALLGKALGRVAELESLRAAYEQAREELERMTARLRRLEALLNRDSKNSHKPPSTDPPKKRTPPEKKEAPNKRRKGGQLGHDGKNRGLLPPEQVDKFVVHRPDCCENCAAPLPQNPGPGDRILKRHQVSELVDMPVQRTEHQAVGVPCDECGHVTAGTIPTAVTASAFGPALTALGSFLTGNLQASRRQVEEVFEDVLKVPVALGTVSNMEAETTEALEAPHQEAGEAVRIADAKNLDETSWRSNDRLAWLWGAATPVVAFFVIHLERSRNGLKALLGGVYRGVFTSDRWNVYALRAKRWRQLCWAHLLRDFQSLVDGGGPGATIGLQARELAGGMFLVWRDFKEGAINRATLQATLNPVRKELQALFKKAIKLQGEKAAVLCQNLLDLEPALWTFLRVEGVEPTNNHAERMMRKGVMWRKRSFGSRSDRGARFAERILTVVQSRRLQKKSAFSFLVEAIRAHRSGLKAPSLLPA